MSAANLDDVVSALDELHETLFKVLQAIESLEGTVMIHSG